MPYDLTSLGVVQLRSPNQAGTLLTSSRSSVGRHPVRQKHMFVVQFLRSEAIGNSRWRNGVSFVVKAIDRPQVSPVTEEMNQYNKKRLIHTGVKYNPVNCTFYDTTDGAAMEMWLDYARYYFGDYNQSFDANQNGFYDDVLNDNMTDTSPDKTGFGFNIRQDSLDNSGIGSQHFFSSICVYQVWANSYVSYHLVNPRINNFSPDDFTYENSEANTIQMSLSYEAVNHGNSGRPQDIFSEATLAAMFSDGPFDGRTVELDGIPLTDNERFLSTGDLSLDYNDSNPLRDFVKDQLPILAAGRAGRIIGPVVDIITRTTAISQSGGVLSRYGTYDFGNTQSGQSSGGSSLSQVLGGSQTLANALSGNFGALGDVANAVGAAARIAGTPKSDQVSRDGGLALSNQAYNEVNKPRDGTAQLGHRAGEATPVDPKLSRQNSRTTVRPNKLT